MSARVSVGKVVLQLLPLYKRKYLPTAIAKDGVVQVHELFLTGHLRFYEWKMKMDFTCFSGNLRFTIKLALNMDVRTPPLSLIVK